MYEFYKRKLYRSKQEIPLYKRQQKRILFVVNIILLV
ncbi:MAG: hypothetical protein ACI8RD_013332 [Bacillariaceae sp.]|jgi:hypothetical protein